MATRQIGNYRIVEYIGSGGFGSVFKAEDISAPGRFVAIKELHKKHTKSSVMKQRFFHEALAMARLDHPNIPKLFTFGEENGSYYLVMEFVLGVSLGEEIAKSGGIPQDRAVQIITQVLEAVGYAHKNGVIHRDLKPDNIILVQDGDSRTVKVLDFGIAKLIGGENLTMTGEGFGTPSYMSPERIAGVATIDGRADIYSIGIIFYEMLTGTVPFQSTASDPALYWTEMRRQHETNPVPGLAAHGVSPAIEAIIGRAAGKTPETRFGTPDEMLQALRGDGGQATLQMTTQPAACDVYVDNVLRGASDEVRGRLLIPGLSAGPHSIRVAKTGYGLYKLDLVLEGGQQTDLQVQLAARATVAMPLGGAASGEPVTSRMASGDEAATAMLGENSLSVPIGSAPLPPVVGENEGTRKIEPPRPIATQADGPVLTAGAAGAKPSRGKWIAAAASILLLGGLVTGAALVMTGRSRNVPPPEPSPSPAVQESALAQVSSTPETSPTPEATPTKTESPDAAKDAAREAAKLAAEKEQAEKAKELARKEALAKETPSPTPSPVQTPKQPEPPPAPVTQNPPEQRTSLPPGGTACAMVHVSGAFPLQGYSVVALDLTARPGGRAQGGVGPKGNWRRCEFTPGHQVEFRLWGPGRQMAGIKVVTITEGVNQIDFMVSDSSTPGTPGAGTDDMPRRRRRP